MEARLESHISVVILDAWVREAVSGAEALIGCQACLHSSHRMTRLHGEIEREYHKLPLKRILKL